MSNDADKVRRKVLVVDDTPENIQLLIQFLRDELAIVVATSGEKGLLMAAAEPPPDIILLDIRMPGMDGYEVCRRLKASASTKDIPVIFITASSDEEDEQHGLELGAVDYIHKPFNPSLVKARVHNQLELKQHRNHLEYLVDQRTAELVALNASLEERVVEEVAKNVQKDHLMSHQARLAAMGELLRNIAHQWRQPLNNLALMTQCTKMDYDAGKLDAVTFGQFVEKNLEILNYMSSTIDDFSTYFKPEHDLRFFDPYQVITRSVSLLRNSFELMGIKLTVVNQGVKMSSGYSNELSQAVLNILANAKDVLIERKISAPVIEIHCYCENDVNYISLKDNAGGIPAEIIDKIFDPYFTTKFQSQGTGIGLYMAKMVIEKHMDGICRARNRDGGAEFIIGLPVCCLKDETK